MKLINTFFILLTGFFLSANVSAQDTIRIAAVVNKKMISEADLESRLKLAVLSSGMELTQEIRDQLKSQILKTMIDEELKLQEAEKFEIQIPKENIDLAFTSIERSNNMEPGYLKTILAENDIPVETMQSQIKANLSWQEYIRERFHSTVQIGDSEIDRGLQEQEQSIAEPQDLIGEIFLSVESPDQDDQVKNQARELVTNMKQGARFSMLAQQFSNAASAAQGGDIGWVRRSMLEDSLKNALESLHPGEITEEPVRGQNGYYILMLRDHREAGESPGKQTLISFKQVLYPVSEIHSERDFQSAMNTMKSLSGSAHSCGLYGKIASGNKKLKLQEMKEIPFNSLMPQLKDILSKVEVEQATDPIPSDIGIVSFMVCEKKEIDPKKLSRDDMRAMLVDKKLNLLSERELRNLRRASFIDIRI